MGLLAWVQPLEDDWRETLDAVARRRSWPTSRDVARLARHLADLSAAYNDPERAQASMRDAGAARLSFSFARDVPKAAAAVRELIATRTLTLDHPLRVLDLGAGLGATTWGVLRALKAAGARGVIDATWVDTDSEALELGRAIVRERARLPEPIELRVTTRAGDFSAASDMGRFDLVLLGQVLTELDVAAADEVRLQKHATFVRSLLEQHTRDSGALVIIEPALRLRARHLHRVRDALAVEGATLFAPCLHAAPCPALAREGDWCHEDLAVDLPAWLVPVAKAAGLRREGLTFSYCVLGRGSTRLVDAVSAPAGGARLRVVSQSIATKGKSEVFLCGELAGRSGPVAARARTMRLDRDATDVNATWQKLDRGDLVVVTPSPDLERPRIESTTSVSIVELEREPVRVADSETR